MVEDPVSQGLHEVRLTDKMHGCLFGTQQGCLRFLAWGLEGGSFLKQGYPNILGRFPKEGYPNRPPNTRILITGTPRKVPFILGKPHLRIMATERLTAALS